MRVGYARVSADDQNLDRQRAALASAGCDQLVEEVESGVKARNRLGSLLSRLAPGDELVVKSLDRLGRRAGELVILLDEQHRRGVNVCILDMPWLDYSAPIGRFIAQMFAALAELEREQTRERQRGGIDAAKRAGRHLGRPPKLTGAQIQEAAKMILEERPPAEVAGLFRVHAKTLKRAVRRHTVRLPNSTNAGRG
jgi:DNA invertase Pin-like site-specific DNA recombinase